MFRKLFNLILGFFDRCSDLLATPGKWLERQFARSLSSADALSNDRWLTRILLWLFEPFRWVLGTLDRLSGLKLGGRKVDRSLDDEEVLLRKLQRSEKINNLQQNIKRSWVSRLGQIVLFPILVIPILIYLIIRSRTGGRVFIPLMVLAMATGALAFLFLSSYGQGQMVARYEAAIARAISEDDFATAELYRRKLEQLGARTEISQYRTAIALDSGGKMEEAYAVMVSLAPESQLGFAPAHLWIAAKLLEGKLPFSQTTSVAKAMLHLKQAETDLRLESRVHYLRGMAFVSVNNISRATEELSAAAMEFPDAAYTLLELQVLQNSPDRLETARIAERHLVKARTNSINPEAEMMAQAHVQIILGSFEKVGASIREFKASLPENRQVSAITARLDLLYIRRWLDDDDSNSVQLIDDIEVKFNQAVDVLPESQFQMAQETLIKIWLNRGKERGRMLYERLIDEKDANGTVLEFFASTIAGPGNWDDARLMLERAVDLDPNNTKALNNLAHILSRYNPERMDDALELANRAVELEPNDSRFRETRGYIELQKEMWPEMIVDFEIAVNGLGERRQLLEALARAYQEIGEPSVAEKYAKAASRATE